MLVPRLLLIIRLAVDGGAKVAATQRANAIADEAARAGGQALDISAALTGQVRVDPVAAVAAARIPRPQRRARRGDRRRRRHPARDHHHQPAHHLLGLIGISSPWRAPAPPTLSPTPARTGSGPMTTPPRALDLRRLLALLVLTAAVAGVPIALWELGGAYLPDELPSWAQVTTALGGPDTGGVFLGMLVVIGWTAWACFALSVAVELVDQLRGLPPPRLPGLTAPQQLAGLLVAAVLGVGSGPLLAAPAVAGPPFVAEQPVGHEEPPPRPPHRRIPCRPHPLRAVPYTVQPRDTLGRIAARYLELDPLRRSSSSTAAARSPTARISPTRADPPRLACVLPPDAALPEQARLPRR